MKKIVLAVSVIGIYLLFLVSHAISSNALKLPKIDRIPNPTDWGRGELNSLPKYNPAEPTNPFQVDLRCYDLSRLDLRNSINDLQYASFDDRTVWPASEHIPSEFDWKQFMETGKNPGLGIRKLHEKGITGRSVGIAILDQPLLVDHVEYAESLRLYEEINIQSGMESQMHGPAVASIAVGRTLGVAPEADLYYIAQWNGDWENGKFTWNFEYLAQGVRRILEINEQLPEDRKIRVISMSVGWEPSQQGYKEITEATQKAKKAGMLVICSSTDKVHGFRFHGLGRISSANPDEFDSYEPGAWWAKMFYDGNPFHGGMNRLLVPMDSRTTASPTGTNEYVFYRHGGWSWSIPYIAGVYALGAQVESNITPERFWALAMKTGRNIMLNHNDKQLRFGPILDPVRLIEAVKAGELSDKDAIAAELSKYNKSDLSTPVTSTVQQDIQAKVSLLDVNKATRQDVIKIFGQPLSYRWGARHFARTDLPNRYLMCYPDRFRVAIVNDQIQELRFHTPGYVFQNKIQVGSTLDDILRVLGPPTETLVGKKNDYKDGILYKNIDGRQGNCYYSRADLGVRVFLANNRVTALYVTSF